MDRFFLLCLTVTALSSCVSLKDRQPVTDESHELWQQRQLSLSPLQHWSIRGRVAMFVDDDVYNLGLTWNRKGDLTTLKLEASLGQGVIQLEKKAFDVNLTTAEGEHYTGTNAEQVLRRSTGLSIPVEGLQTWIKGIPHLNSAYLPDIDASGRATTIHQDGWRINYLKYNSVVLQHKGTTVLPQKIYMRRDNLALKIVIDQWQPMTGTQASDLFPEFPD